MKPISPEIHINSTMSESELVELGKHYRDATQIAVRLDDERHHQTYPIKAGSGHAQLAYLVGINGKIRFLK